MTTTRSGLNSTSNVKQKLNTKQKRKTKAKTTTTRKNAQSTPENTKSASKTMITRSSERIADARLKMKIAKASPKNTPSSSRTMVTRSSGINVHTSLENIQPALKRMRARSSKTNVDASPEILNSKIHLEASTPSVDARVIIVIPDSDSDADEEDDDDGDGEEVEDGNEVGDENEVGDDFENEVGRDDSADEAGEGVGRDNVGDADANANATPMFIPMHIVELNTTSDMDLIPSMTADWDSQNLGYLMEMGSEAEPEPELALGLDPGLEYHGTGDDYLLSPDLLLDMGMDVDLGMDVGMDVGMDMDTDMNTNIDVYAEINTSPSHTSWQGMYMNPPLTPEERGWNFSDVGIEEIDGLFEEMEWGMRGVADVDM